MVQYVSWISICHSWKKEILKHVRGVEKYWYMSSWIWNLRSLCHKVVRLCYKGFTFFPSNPYRCLPTSHRFDSCLELPSLSHWNSSGWALHERTPVYSYGKAIIHGWLPFHGKEQIFDPERFRGEAVQFPGPRREDLDEQKIFAGGWDGQLLQNYCTLNRPVLCVTSSLGPTLVWSQGPVLLCHNLYWLCHN